MSSSRMVSPCVTSTHESKSTARPNSRLSGASESRHCQNAAMRSKTSAEDSALGRR